MENNENKARFFALYYGQSVMLHNEVKNLLLSPEYAIVIDNCGYIHNNIKESCLSLRSIESLTDEEILKVVELSGGKCFIKNCTIEKSDNYYSRYKIKNRQGFMQIGDDRIVVNHDRPMSLESHWGIDVIDYLRSIGVLIPFMGLSVEEIIEYGWCKINE